MGKCTYRPPEACHGAVWESPHENESNNPTRSSFREACIVPRNDSIVLILQHAEELHHRRRRRREGEEKEKAQFVE